MVQCLGAVLVVVAAVVPCNTRAEQRPFRHAGVAAAAAPEYEAAAAAAAAAAADRARSSSVAENEQP